MTKPLESTKEVEEVEKESEESEEEEDDPEYFKTFPTIEELGHHEWILKNPRPPWEGVMTVMPITTVKEKAQRRLEVKARSTLMMGIPNEHQLKFNSNKAAKEVAGTFPPPYTRNLMPLTPDLSFNGLDEFVNKPVVENSKAMSSKEEPKIVKKNDDALIIKEWVSMMRKQGLHT
ncbi:hypothetical protein Tco_0514378 [Tanacetum coccineum]